MGTWHSPDGGETWEQPRFNENLPDAGTQASIMRFSSEKEQMRNRVLFSNPGAPYRGEFTIRMSYDEGETWPISKLVYQGAAGYSQLAVLSDHSILALFETGRYDLRESITLVRVDLDWLSGGKGEHFCVLAWDVRGHGLSRPATFDLREAVADLLAILDRLDMPQAIFVGHSMGGNLHQELVFHHPERVQAMAFLDCTWNFQKLSPMDTLTLRLAKPIFELYPHKRLVDQSLALTAITKASQDSLRPAVESLSKAEFIQIMMATSACLHYEPGYKINKPLLLMVGDQDKTGNIRKMMPVWAAQEPDCRLVVIPDASHAPNLDNPDFFHATLLEFLLAQSA